MLSFRNVDRTLSQPKSDGFSVIDVHACSGTGWKKSDLFSTWKHVTHHIERENMGERAPMQGKPLSLAHGMNHKTIRLSLSEGIYLIFERIFPPNLKRCFYCERELGSTYASLMSVRSKLAIVRTLSVLSTAFRHSRNPLPYTHPSVSCQSVRGVCVGWVEGGGPSRCWYTLAFRIKLVK